MVQAAPQSGKKIRPFNNFTATVDPSSGDDQTQGYTPGSRWFNTSTGILWTCLSAATGAASWAQHNHPQATANERDSQGQHFFGRRLDYPNNGGMTANVVQYVRVWLEAQLALTKMQTFISSGAGGNVNLGIYDQATPTSNAGTPRNLLASVGLTALAGGDNATFKTINLLAPLTITTTGYYWLALVGDTGSVRYALSAGFRSAFFDGATNPALRFEAVVGVALPAGPAHTFLASGINSLAFAAAVE